MTPLEFKEKVKALPPRLRRTVVDYAGSKLTAKEIAKRDGIAPSTVWGRLSQAEDLLGIDLPRLTRRGRPRLAAA